MNVQETFNFYLNWMKSDEFPILFYRKIPRCSREVFGRFNDYRL